MEGVLSTLAVHGLLSLDFASTSEDIIDRSLHSQGCAPQFPLLRFDVPELPCPLQAVLFPFSSVSASAASGGSYPHSNEAFGRGSTRPLGRGSTCPFLGISSAAAWSTDGAVRAVGFALALVSPAPVGSDGLRGLLGGLWKRRRGLSKPRCIPELVANDTTSAGNSGEACRQKGAVRITCRLPAN